MSYPSGVTYASGHSIPLKLIIQSLEAPALAELLIRGLEAQLVKRMVAWSSSGQLVGGREVIVSKGNFIETDASQEGLAVSYFELALGESGKEQSWGIAKVAEVSVSFLFCRAIFSTRLTFGRTVSDSSHRTQSRKCIQLCANI